jgi:alkylation response protein AidB-like acyl-CoA dehydrogenase
MDLTAILEKSREIALNVLAADAEEVDRQARWPERGLRALQGAGLGGLVVPRSSGGLGQGLSGLVQVCEVLGGQCASTGLCFGMHCVGAAVIAAKATPEQQGYLEAIAQGRHLTTLALSEPGTGSHFYYPQTRLIAVSRDLFQVEGKKSFVTNGGYAGSYVVSTVAADPQAPPGQFSCVVIPRDAQGLRWGPPWRGLGMRGNSSCTVELRQVPVPRSALLGEEGDQIWYVFNVVAPYFLMAMAGVYLGIAGAALEEVQAHLGERSYAHSGALLGQAVVLQHRLGSLWATVERTRRLVYYAAEEFDAGGADALPALLAAKAEVGDGVVEVVNQAMTLAGGLAYQENGRLARLLRDARAAHVMAPTTDILRTWTGRALLGQPLLGD